MHKNEKRISSALVRHSTVSMDVYGCLWMSMDVYACLWMSMVYCGMMLAGGFLLDTSRCKVCD